MPIQTNTTASDGTDLGDADLTVSCPTGSLHLGETPVNVEGASTRVTYTVSVVRQKSTEETTPLKLSIADGADGLSGQGLPKRSPTGSDPGSKPKHSIPISRSVVLGHPKPTGTGFQSRHSGPVTETGGFDRLLAARPALAVPKLGVPSVHPDALDSHWRGPTPSPGGSVG